MQTFPAPTATPLVARRGWLRWLPTALKELAGRRELLWNMTVRGVKSQYQQSILGYAWAVLNPLLQMAVLTFVFSTLLNLFSLGYPYPLFLYVGLLPWTFFSHAVASATDSVAGSASLITKVYFPREILPIAAVLGKVVDLAFGALVLVSLFVLYRHSLSLMVLWVPVIFAIQLIFTVGVSLPLAALNLFYRDIRYLVGVALMLWMYLTPVVYPVPERYRFVFDLNPMSVLINAYRQVVLVGKPPDVAHLGLALLVSGLTFLVGYTIFKKLEPAFADSI